MRILFLTEGTTIPASRFRVGQFIPHFRDRGIECVVRPGYGDLYNQIAPTPLGAPYKLVTRLMRIVRSVDAGAFDVVFLQRPALPFTALPEQLIHGLNDRTIFDVDDAIFLAPDGSDHPTAGPAFAAIVDTVEHVICGNTFLADRVDHPDKTTVIPTVIDCERYRPAADSTAAGDDLTIGWMGTASNFHSLRIVAPVVEQFLDDHPDTRFRIVSNETFPDLAHHPRVEEIRWSSETEIPLLQSFDIGLMPLVDTPASRGKCGFKMIQYMAVGTPVISSPVGANVDIFQGSDAGFLAGDHAAWGRALERLVDDEQHRLDCGRSARQHAVEYYSIRSVIDDYIELFSTVASPQPS